MLSAHTHVPLFSGHRLSMQRNYVRNHIREGRDEEVEAEEEYENTFGGFRSHRWEVALVDQQPHHKH